MKIYKSFFLLVVLFLNFVLVIGQEQDTINYRYEGLRIGADVGNYLINSGTGDKTEFMILTDYEFVQDRYAVFEGGFSLIDDVNDSLVNKINGGFGLIGIDFNFYDRKRRINDDILYFGLRYAYSAFTHDYSLNENYIAGTFTEEGRETYSAQWAEFVFGGKGELWFLKNVFLGLSLRVKVLTTKKEADLVVPSRIPGFGSYSRGAVVGLNWTLSYRIPFKKIKVLPTKKKDKKKSEKNGKS